MPDDDQQREVEIDAAYASLLSAETLDQKRAAFGRMKELIAGRSPAQIERMELAQGLR